MQKIISWNVASVRARLPALLKFLEQEQPDIMFLQEIKATDDTFPFFDLQIAGYTSVISGQKGYNGVAILSRQPVRNITDTLPNFTDQARFLQVETFTGQVLICIYAPNGNPPEKDPTDTTRLTYKLNWFSALKDHLAPLIQSGKSIILGGDFNVIERDTDVYCPDLFRNSALMIPPVRQAFTNLNNLPLHNIIRHFYPDSNTYSFWDFQGGAWPKNNGILLDFFLTDSKTFSCVKSAKIYKEVRGWPQTSDHVPIGMTLDLP